MQDTKELVLCICVLTREKESAECVDTDSELAHNFAELCFVQFFLDRHHDQSRRRHVRGVF